MEHGITLYELYEQPKQHNGALWVLALFGAGLVFAFILGKD